MQVSQHRSTKMQGCLQREEEGGIPVLGVVVAMAGDGENGHGGVWGRVSFGS
jgi:hypothetical protein